MGRSIHVGGYGSAPDGPLPGGHAKCSVYDPGRVHAAPLALVSHLAHVSREGALPIGIRLDSVPGSFTVQ